jgi:hypothetical protein
VTQPTEFIVETSIEGTLGHMGDVDFFKFRGVKGERINIDIDSGSGVGDSVDTYIAVFKSDGTILSTNDDSTVIDSGSTSNLDSYIEAFKVPEDDYYIIGVTNYFRTFVDNGMTVPGSVKSPDAQQMAGDYVLNITYSKIPRVAIWISPGKVHYRPIKPGKPGTVKVAILSEADFMAELADPSTITFGVTGDEVKAKKCRSKDVNRDGLQDLVCKFNLLNAGFTTLDEEAILKGETFTGQAFEGQGYIKIVKYHRGHHYKRHHERRRHRDDD